VQARPAPSMSQAGSSVAELPLDEVLTLEEVVSAVTELPLDEVLPLEELVTAVVDVVCAVFDERNGETVVCGVEPPAPPPGGRTATLPPQYAEAMDTAKAPLTQTSRRKDAMVSP
jgi:hypothetical protein